ncbi:murein hydrolase activator EnvC family protein [Lentibacillus sediminis]|uniref:murein hydrolase activator EnvC family protein n=1 Tax=Lentibacillus sediminis TaxID=1940529 RepID=UPI000C1C7D10|nr:M23 family metallopeptidase [Lentibacillus sediminis]
MKKVLSGALAVLLTVSVAGNVNAESINDLENEINELENKNGNLEEKRENVESKKEETQSDIKENEAEQGSVAEEINQLEQELNEKIEQISAKENQIETTNQEIEALNDRIIELKDEIEVLEERIAERNELLKDRLRSIQQNGGPMKYIEVIFGSQSFSDFVSRSSAVNTIMDSDKAIMEAQKADKEALNANKEEVEASKVKVEEKKAALVGQKEELVTLKAQLADQKKEQESLMAQLEEEHGNLQEVKLSQEEKQQILAAEAEANKKAIAMAQEKKGELEQLAREKAAREKAAREEAAREQAAREKAEREQAQREQEQAEAEQNDSSTDDSNESSPDTVVASNSSSSGSGIFSWPAAGGVNSNFGMRFHPIDNVMKLHAGIDMPTGMGTTLRAAADGVVSRASTLGGFGNVIMISHHINGQSYTTVYAHLSSMSVSPGQTVSEGQVIGATGNTGNSTGPHLHFEVHPGGYGNPVNPLPYMK